MENINTNPDKQELRKFGLIFAGMFILIFALLLPWIWDKSSPMWAWIVAAVFAGTGLLLPMALTPVYHLWMKIGHVLGWINTRIILGIMFYCLFLPVGILMRLLGKDPLARSLEKTRNSYRVIHPTRKKDHVERPY